MKTISKTDEAIQLFKEKKYKESLKIVKTFKSGFTKEQIRIITIAYESYDERKKAFYQKMNINVPSYQFLAKMMILIKYKLYLDKSIVNH